MLLALSADQELFRQTVERFLDEFVPVDEIRRLHNDPAGFDGDYWRRGAELGWTSLLVKEAHGGGSVSGKGLVDLSLVAHEFGRRAAPGPLVTTNVVAAALSNCSSTAHDHVLAGVLSGELLATWCYSEPPPHDALGRIALEIEADAKGFVLNGSKRPVESAGRAQYLLVSGRTQGDTTQVLVPAETPGVRISPLHSIDLTRRFCVVSFEDVRVPFDAVVGEVGQGDADVERQLELAMALMNAESVGAMQSAFEMTTEWAFDRYTFGRPLASYQEIKHRLADMKAWLEAAHAITDLAIASLEDGSSDSCELVSAAKAFVGDYGTELVQDCVQIHGGIGVTFAHDLHLFLRRVVLNRALYGTPAELTRRIGKLYMDREDAA
jgi:alkylation response protein AidB-like acyl-CoA dehydrogenase